MGRRVAKLPSAALQCMNPHEFWVPFVSPLEKELFMLRKVLPWFGLGLSAGLILLLSSCGNVCTLGQGDCSQALGSSTLTLAAGSTTMAVSSTLTFTTTGGTSPFTYAVLVGGGSVTVTTSTASTTTVLTAQSTTGVACVRVTDSVGATADRCVTVL